MPNKTLYIKDSDLELWDRAQNELGGSLSAMFIECLKTRLAKVEDLGKMAKISLEFWNADEQPVIKKSFTGRWLVGDAANGIGPEQDDSGVSWDWKLRYSVAQTAQGRIVVYEAYEDDSHAPGMEVYDNFEALQGAEIDNRYPRYPQNIIAETAAALGEPYEIELDI